MDNTNYEQTTIGEIVPTNDDDNTNDEYDNQQVLEEDNHPSYDFPPSSSLVIASTSNDNTTTDCQFPDDCQEQLKNDNNVNKQSRYDSENYEDAPYPLSEVVEKAAPDVSMIARMYLYLSSFACRLILGLSHLSFLWYHTEEQIAPDSSKQSRFC